MASIIMFPFLAISPLLQLCCNCKITVINKFKKWVADASLLFLQATLDEKEILYSLAPLKIIRFNNPYERADAGNFAHNVNLILTGIGIYPNA